MRTVLTGHPRRLVGAAALLLALSLSSTAVLAYADLLPQGGFSLTRRAVAGS